MINREIFPELLKEVDKKQITALVGARQVGKTTLLEQLQEEFKNKNIKTIFFSFEDSEYLNLFNNDIRLFIERFIEPYEVIFIDEFQYAKNGGKQLKFIYDTIKEKKLFISGSSHAELAIHSLQYLVGRVSIIEIFPITFKEFLNFKNNRDSIYLNSIREFSSFQNILRYFNEYLIFGGYPEVVIEKYLNEKQKLLKNIIQSYLFKEIRDILEYKNHFEFENVLKRLALQDGKLLNKNSFSEDFGIYFNKLNEMIHTLDKTYIVYLLQPFLRNKIKEQIKSPKTYFQDLGFKNSLINNFNEHNLRQDKGEIYENFIFNELNRLGIRTQFFNEQNRYEMDFVYEKDGEIVGIECKSKVKSNKITSSMKKFIEYFKPSKIVVFNENLDDEVEFEGCKIIFTHYLNVHHIENM